MNILNLRENIIGLDSIIQVLADTFQYTCAMKLIVCGSYVGTMINLLSEQNSLYGRAGLTIHLKPMDYYESALFYKEYTHEDKIRIYSVFGGIPYYNRLTNTDLYPKAVLHVPGGQIPF